MRDPDEKPADPIGLDQYLALLEMHACDRFRADDLFKFGPPDAERMIAFVRKTHACMSEVERARPADIPAARRAAIAFAAGLPAEEVERLFAEFASLEKQRRMRDLGPGGSHGGDSRDR